MKTITFERFNYTMAQGWLIGGGGILGHVNEPRKAINNRILTKLIIN
jgi:hypothetical protein